jgi:multidrug efflux pump subunit AcrA (membrane-fusion protein)
MIPLGLHWYGSHGINASEAGRPVEAMAQPAVDETKMVAVVPGIRGRVVVPEAAVTEIDGKATVFVAEQSLHLLVATPVELGHAKGAHREILSGVTAGQMVVTNGVSALRTMASR